MITFRTSKSGKFFTTTPPHLPLPSISSADAAIPRCHTLHNTDHAKSQPGPGFRMDYFPSVPAGILQVSHPEHCARIQALWHFESGKCRHFLLQRVPMPNNPTPVSSNFFHMLLFIIFLLMKYNAQNESKNQCKNDYAKHYCAIGFICLLQIFLVSISSISFAVYVTLSP